MKIVPIAMGALGSISKRLNDFLKILDLEHLNTYILQKMSFLGTATILRKAYLLTKIYVMQNIFIQL